MARKFTLLKSGNIAVILILSLLLGIYSGAMPLGVGSITAYAGRADELMNNERDFAPDGSQDAIWSVAIQPSFGPNEYYVTIALKLRKVYLVSVDFMLGFDKTRLTPLQNAAHSFAPEPTTTGYSPYSQSFARFNRVATSQYIYTGGPVVIESGATATPSMNMGSFNIFSLRDYRDTVVYPEITFPPTFTITPIGSPLVTHDLSNIGVLSGGFWSGYEADAYPHKMEPDGTSLFSMGFKLNAAGLPPIDENNIQYLFFVLPRRAVAADYVEMDQSLYGENGLRMLGYEYADAAGTTFNPNLGGSYDARYDYVTQNIRFEGQTNAYIEGSTVGAFPGYNDVQIDVYPHGTALNASSMTIDLWRKHVGTGVAPVVTVTSSPANGYFKVEVPYQSGATYTLVFTQIGALRHVIYDIPVVAGATTTLHDSDPSASADNGKIRIYSGNSNRIDASSTYANLNDAINAADSSTVRSLMNSGGYSVDADFSRDGVFVNTADFNQVTQNINKIEQSIPYSPRYGP